MSTPHGSERLRIVVELSEGQIEEIARRAIVLARAELRPPPPSRYLTIPEAAAYVRCRRQRVDDLLSQPRLRRVKDGAPHAHGADRARRLPARRLAATGDGRGVIDRLSGRAVVREDRPRRSSGTKWT